jgi:hypothetical protein
MGMSATLVIRGNLPHPIHPRLFSSLFTRAIHPSLPPFLLTRSIPSGLPPPYSPVLFASFPRLAGRVDVLPRSWWLRRLHGEMDGMVDGEVAECELRSSSGGR